MEALLKSQTAMEILTTISLAQFLVVLVLLIGIGVVIYKFKDAIKEYLEDYRKKTNPVKQVLVSHGLASMRVVPLFEMIDMNYNIWHNTG